MLRSDTSQSAQESQRSATNVYGALNGITDLLGRTGVNAVTCIAYVSVA